ncbi:MAG: hypothetical protein AABX24_02615 [Nanoarchaeota archaeon]
MTELRTLHLTDIHDDWEKYEVIAQYLVSKKDNDQAIDAVFVTGDFIDTDPENKNGTAHQIVQSLKQLLENGTIKAKAEEFETLVAKHQKEGKIDLGSLDEGVRKQFETLRDIIQTKQSEVVAKTDTESYQRHAEELSRMEVPVYGVLGNHDLTFGYDVLRNKVTFLDKINKAAIKGKTGLEFILKGDINTTPIEIPSFYGKFLPLVKQYFIPYLSGYSLSELSKAENELQKNLADGQDERLEKIAKKEEPNYSEEQLREMQAQLEQTIELRKVVLAYNQAERQRLGDKNEVDIYLTHKLPSCKRAYPGLVGPLSDITTEYAAKAKAVHGGHLHNGQIGYKTIDDFLKQETTETVTVDGTEVPVFYLADKEPRELNPGTKYFFVTEYDANKEIEQVVVHEFYYEETA